LKTVVRILLFPIIAAAYLLFHPIAMTVFGVCCIILLLSRRKLKVNLG
jgi:hypothetical protein